MKAFLATSPSPRQTSQEWINLVPCRSLTWGSQWSVNSIQMFFFLFKFCWCGLYLSTSRKLQYLQFITWVTKYGPHVNPLSGQFSKLIFWQQHELKCTTKLLSALGGLSSIWFFLEQSCGWQVISSTQKGPTLSRNWMDLDN